MVQEEQVLVVERKVLERVGMFQGLVFDVEPYLRELLASGIPRFMNRSEAEENPDYKQLIPYVLIECDGRLLSYVRGKRAGEKRLVGHRSIGIGGHINPADDAPLFSADFRDAYLTAVEREVTEEICIETGHNDQVVGLLNDDSTEVGQVHLGIVHCWKLDEPKVTKKEQMITQVGFMSPAELIENRDTLETWSSLCLEHLDRLMRHTDSELRPAGPSR